MKSFLLTGFNGFLGSFIQEFILSNSLYELTRIGRSHMADMICDIVNEVPTFKQRYDVVIHAAGKAHQTPKNEKEDDEFYKVNVLGTTNLLKALELSFLPKSFIFISSVAVYGLSKGSNIKEEALLLAEDPYGVSKIKAEKVVQEWCSIHGVICTVLRLPLIAGPSPPGNLGTMIKGIQKGYYFNIGGGGAKKSMVLATDVAKYILQAAQVGGTFNLTDGYHPNFNELSDLIAKQLGKNKVRNIPNFVAKSIAKVGDFFGSKAPLNSDKFKKITSTLTFDDSKARVTFGWNPTPVLEGLKILDSTL
ncbi:MAG: NAD-dependent epimerase/dehydratase family protein [Chitinophagaceae bacterium]|nr:NAD-dependent epimerase/dehydratase family protein [Chitinophagaceae bacterium]